MLTEQQAKELHASFMTVTVLYVAIAVVAHILMWMWRPWFPGTPGYQRATEVIDGITPIITSLV
jgi:light-harvesting complex 1 beta chain